jgi:hypothetical protein
MWREGVSQIDNCKRGGICLNLPQPVDTWLKFLDCLCECMSCLLWKREISNVSTKVTIEVLVQKLKISQDSSLNVMVCPFSRGIWITTYVKYMRIWLSCLCLLSRAIKFLLILWTLPPHYFHVVICFIKKYPMVIVSCDLSNNFLNPQPYGNWQI